MNKYVLYQIVLNKGKAIHKGAHFRHLRKYNKPDIKNINKDKICCTH